MQTFTHIHTNTHIHSHKHTHAHTYTQTHIQTSTHIYRHMHTHVFLIQLSDMGFTWLPIKSVSRQGHFIVEEVIHESDSCMVISKNVNLVGWGCRIHQLHLCKEVTPLPNEYPRYDIKQSDGEALVMLELWGMQSTPLLPLLPDTLWPGVVAPDRVLSKGQIGQFNI